ncbi:MAG: GNAT family N-acetyltransferase [Alphaproteobacteria bacterium]|nr:GNAT family N-acetyltransferase [Alphaproteobacteria bacterium]
MQDSSYNIDILGRHKNHKQIFSRMLEEHKFFQNGEMYFERCFERQALGELEIILAWKDAVCADDKQAVGYALLNWQPKYTYFKVCNIPEIQDMNVISTHRRQGIGQAIIEFCEKQALDKEYKEMGIGVGLDSSFGAAQRLYTCMGYIPDGRGISYDRKQVVCGEFRPIDENLCLMMSKCI